MSPLERRIKKNGKVDLWDTGPTRPVAPKEPAAPDEKLKGVELAAAQVEYEDALERYKNELRAFTAAKRAFTEWHDKNGGPVKVELWGVDARFALEREPDRFKLDLARNQKPGRAQIEAEEMAALEAEGLERTRASDPQFGNRVSA